MSATQLDATASVPGTFTYTPAAGTVLGAGNNQTLSVTFTPTDTTDYTTATATATINVLPGDADDHLGQARGHRLRHGLERHAARRHGQRARDLRLHAGRGHRPGRRQQPERCRSPSRPPTRPTTPLPPRRRRSTSCQATPTITWANPAGIVYGTAFSATQLDATASVPGTFTYTPAAGTVLGAGNNQSLSVTFTPTDTTDYTTATATATINAGAGDADDHLGQARRTSSTARRCGATQLDATASVPGTFTYTPAAGDRPGRRQQPDALGHLHAHRRDRLH